MISASRRIDAAVYTSTSVAYYWTVIVLVVLIVIDYFRQDRYSHVIITEQSHSKFVRRYVLMPNSHRQTRHEILSRRGASASGGV